MKTATRSICWDGNGWAFKTWFALRGLWKAVANASAFRLPLCAETLVDAGQVEDARALGFEVDYKNLLAHFRQRSYLVRAYYYTALLETEEYSPLRPLVDWLGYNGYSVVTKPAKEFTDATGRRRVKGSVDIEMAVDVLDLTPHLDHVVIFSGDGDLRRLVESVQRRGVRVTVISTIRTQPAMIADDLRRQADAFIDLADLAEHITRRQMEPRQRAASVDARPVPLRACSAPGC